MEKVREVQVGYGFKVALCGVKIGNLKSQYSIKTPKKRGGGINFKILFKDLSLFSEWKKIQNRYWPHDVNCSVSFS
jgi:hypothetical protein